MLSFGCCDPSAFKKKFDFSCEETDDGITVKIKGKNPKETDALKKMFSAWQTLCCDEGSCNC